MRKHQSFVLGFGCCLLLLLTVLCFLIEMGRTERGSGRIKPIIIAQTILTQSNQSTAPETKPEREPPKGNGRKD